MGALEWPVTATQQTQLQLTLANRSRIIALPSGPEGATIRGYTADLVVADESARIPDPLIAAVRPMLAVSGGRFIARSTPAGAMGWMWEAWTLRLRVRALQGDGFAGAASCGGLPASRSND